MRSVFIPLAIVAMLAAGCGSGAADTSEPERKGDAGAYFFDSVRANRVDRPAGGPPAPETLTAMLPCGTYRHPLSARGVVVGEVREVRAGDAYVWGDEAEVPEMLESYDDPRADARDILITLHGRMLLRDGPEDADATVTARMSVPDGADPAKFLDSADALGDVVVFLSPRSTDPHPGDLFPVLSGALIGQVDDGAVTFPGMDDPGFTVDLTTTDAILAACPER